MPVPPSSNLSLQIDQRVQQNLTQRLMMSAHMQQAIRLLQLPLIELHTFIEEQTVLNPLLEIAENDANESEDTPDSSIVEEPKETQEQEIIIDEHDFTVMNQLDEEWWDHLSDQIPHTFSREDEKLRAHMEQSIQRPISLYDHLLNEAHDLFEDEKEREIAEILIGYIDQNGFLTTSLFDICAFHELHEEKIVEKVLRGIQKLEPFGVGASSIQESLLIQLRCLHKEESVAYQIIELYYEDFLHNHIPFIQKSLKCSYEQIQRAIEKDIGSLDLHPGAQFSSFPAPSVLIPDVTLRHENDQLLVDIERDYLPPLRLNRRYMQMLEDKNLSHETKIFIKQHLFSARWLNRNLQQRYSTIERIAQSLTNSQYQFFTQPNGQLTPITMKSIAAELELHESTIARAVANKYIDTPRGIFPLRYFFTTKYISQEGEDLSSKTIQDRIADLIQQEDRKHPISDEKISLLLKQQHIVCARRTVAKYREALGIGNTQIRRKFN
jgi:RNA polymerase sigma-54 factor